MGHTYCMYACVYVCIYAFMYAFTYLFLTIGLFYQTWGQKGRVWKLYVFYILS